MVSPETQAFINSIIDWKHIRQAYSENRLWWRDGAWQMNECRWKGRGIAWEVGPRAWAMLKDQ